MLRAVEMEVVAEAEEDRRKSDEADFDGKEIGETL